MELQQVNLPKKYEYKEGITNPLYKQFDGWNKISYSQVVSFKDYKDGYIQDYILGKRKDDSGIFARFGSSCGDFLNPDDQEEYEMLSQNDIDILQPLKDNHPKGSVFEYEIIISLEPFGLEKTCIQCFTDRQYIENGKLIISDYKTLTVKTKKAYYESDEYKQLDIYGYGLEEQGYTIGDMYVTGLGRSGNTAEKGNKNVLRLSGEIITINKPYNREKSLKIMGEIVETCKEISNYFSIYKKVFCI